MRYLRRTPDVPYRFSSLKSPGVQLTPSFTSTIKKVEYIGLEKISMISYKGFIQAFEAAFKEHQHNLLWNERNLRTDSMKRFIYSSIDNYFDLSVHREYDHIDAVLYKWSSSEMMNDQNLIEAVIEYEDNPRTIHNELRHFLRHKFPLNFLITYPKMPTNDEERKAT
jgi:hypothetical protein